MFTPLQACMDSTDWLQGTLNDDMSLLMDSSSSPSGDMLTCSRPMMERRLRPHHDQPLKCPRCDSVHTKFCYYNNYSLSQPRYFCKTCRRYWTKGGNLRNIPVGGGCRKNKKVSASSSSSGNSTGAKSKLPVLTGASQQINQQGMPPSSTDLHLSFSPDIHLSQLNTMIKPTTYSTVFHSPFGDPAGSFGFLESKFNPIMEMGDSPGGGAIDFMASGDRQPNPADNQIYPLGLVGDVMGVNHTNFQGICSPFGIMSLDGHSNNGGSSLFMENRQKLIPPYNQVQGQADGDRDHHQDQATVITAKTNHRILPLEWQQDQNCSSDAGKNSSFRYLGGLGSTWSNGMMNEYNSSASTNPLA